MKIFARFTAFLILANSAAAQGLVTPQDFTYAGAGGPVSGTIPHGATYASPPPVNNGLNNSSAITPSMPTSANTSQAMKRIPIITSPGPKTKAGKREKRQAKDSDAYDLKDGGIPSIMIEDRG